MLFAALNIPESKEQIRFFGAIMIISTFFGNILSAALQNGLTPTEIAFRCIQSGVTGIDIEEEELDNPNLHYLLDAGMQITSLIVRRDLLHSSSENVAEEVVRLAVKYKSPRILMIPGYFKADDTFSAAENALSPLRRICALAKKENITVGVEDYDHVAAPTSTISGLNYFLDRIPALSCCFDTGNFIFMAEDVPEAYRMLKHRITAQIHCKDRALTGRDGEMPAHSKAGLDLYPCAVGSGVIPIRDIVCDLVKNGFDGVLTAELFGSSDTLGDLEKSAGFIKDCIANTKRMD